MKSTCILAMALSLGALVCSPMVTAQGQNDQRTLTITNLPQLNPIPLGGTAQIEADGNIKVACAESAPGQPVEDCSNIGTGVVPAAPVLTFIAPEETVSEQGKRLTWTTTNGEVCFGSDVSPQDTESLKWKTQWPASTQNGFLLDALLASLPLNDAREYSFKLRCYAAPVVAGDSSGPSAYSQETRTVTLKRIQNNGGQSCEAYLLTLQGMTSKESGYDNEYERFEAYRAETRGFTRDANTFTGKTGHTLGASNGPIGRLPGKIQHNRYLALDFSLTQTNQYFTIKTGTLTGDGGMSHNTIFSLSPCPGDFRPRSLAPDETDYIKGACRTGWDQNGSIGGTDYSSPYCSTPKDQKMYLNIAVQNMYTTPGASGGVPASGCSPTVKCGVGTDLTGGVLP